MDGGSTCSLITHELADELGLKGTATTEWIELAGEKPKLWDTKYYIFTWHLPDGTVKQMKLLGMKNKTWQQPIKSFPMLKQVPLKDP